MFNLGGRAFTRRLALAFGLSYEEAEGGSSGTRRDSCPPISTGRCRSC